MKKSRRDAKTTIRELEAMPKLQRGPARPRAPSLGDIRDAFFPPQRGGHRVFRNKPLDVRKLSKDERRILELLCELDPDGGAYGHSGLPPDIRSRRRVAGVDPPSVLDARWRTLRDALDDYERKYVNKPKEHPRIETFIAEKYFDVSPVEWLEIWTEAAARAYGIIATWDEPLPRAAAAASPAQRKAWAEKWTQEIMTSLDDDLRELVAPKIVRAFKAAKETLPPKFVAMMKVKRAREKVVKPKPAPKPKPLGKWTFRGKNMDLRDIVRLPRPAMRQFLVAAKKYAGKPFKTAKAFFAWQAKELEGDAADVRLWTISLGKKRVYEMWAFLVDNGTVFPAGAHIPSGVHMIQGSFLVEDKRAESKQLAEELQGDVTF